MVSICPTITANDAHEYRAQMELIQPFAERVHIDLMDGKFAPSISPFLDSTWWYDSMTTDIHLMYQRPGDYLEDLISLKPNLVVFHFEAEVDHVWLADSLHSAGIKAGLAILKDTSVATIAPIIGSFDHVLIFSGHLGYHGGQADLQLADKAKQLKKLKPELEIAWDGGVSLHNAVELIAAGVSVLNVGGYIHKSVRPAEAYAKLKALAG
jgi:ribulose-phosphate 3-epimerase